MTLLEAALEYLKWGFYPVFAGPRKGLLYVVGEDGRPTRRWMPALEAEAPPDPRELLRTYEAVRARGRLAGVAVVTKPRGDGFSPVAVDIDHAAGNPASKPLAEALLEKGVPVARSPNGLRAVFLVPTGQVPGTWRMEHPTGMVAEYVLQKAYLMPPSFLCLDQPCTRRFQYHFLLARGGRATSPRAVGEPPRAEWGEIEALLSEHGFQVAGKTAAGPVAAPRPGGGGAPSVFPPAFASPGEARAWALAGRSPPLPACVLPGVAGIDPATGRPRRVPEGERFHHGAVAVLFLLATVDTPAGHDEEQAREAVKRLVDFVGENLENYPGNPGGEPLDRSLSRLAVRAGTRLAPRYSGLRSMGLGAFKYCRACPLKLLCNPADTTSGVRPWAAWLHAYYSSGGQPAWSPWRSP